MTDTGIKILGIAIVIILSPLSYIYYFLIWQLPKRFGFFTRWSIVFGYILAFAIDAYLLSEGLIGLAIFILVPIIIQFLGAVYFKEALPDLPLSSCL
jgi:hypothetical protein